MTEVVISRNVFTALFILTGLATLWIGGGFFYEFYKYYELSHEAVVKLDNWKIHEDEDRFTIRVNYSFDWKGQTIAGRYFFPRPVYHNPYIAEEHLKLWKEKEWKIYFNPKWPSDAALQKKFPTKKGIYLGLSLGILLYFLLLKGFVVRAHSLDQRSS